MRRTVAFAGRYRARIAVFLAASVLTAVLGSAATAGTTGATVMLTLTLSTLGLPLDGVGLLPSLDLGGIGAVEDQSVITYTLNVSFKDGVEFTDA